MARTWRLVIAGVGGSRDGEATDADVLASAMARVLAAAGHTITHATFQSEGHQIDLVKEPAESERVGGESPFVKTIRDIARQEIIAIMTAGEPMTASVHVPDAPETSPPDRIADQEPTKPVKLPPENEPVPKGDTAEVSENLAKLRDAERKNLREHIGKGLSVAPDGKHWRWNFASSEPQLLDGPAPQGIPQPGKRQRNPGDGQ